MVFSFFFHLLSVMFPNPLISLVERPPPLLRSFSPSMLSSSITLREESFPLWHLEGTTTRERLRTNHLYLLHSD